ncbi:MAG: pilus assembly protein [Pseudomonadota bacterium]|nr:pilus assembly protein [Pseudomonadota bacterium]
MEIALILPLFLLLMFGIIDFGRMMFTKMTLQHAMREGGRFAVTGERLPDPDNPQTLQSRLQSIRQIVQDSAVGVTVNPNDIVVSSIIGGDDSAGTPGDTVTISMSYRFIFATPLLGRYFNDGSHEFTVSTSFRNEPFPPGAEQ